jgi:CspA family cold shock protein
MSKLIGTVKFFKKDKGFGFIEIDKGHGDVFVHITDVQAAGYDGLAQNDRVEFEKVESKGRFKATNIKIIN